MKIKTIIPIIILIVSINNISAQTSLYSRFSQIEGIKSYYIADVDKLTGCTGCGISGYMGENLKQLLTPEIDLKRIKTVTILMSNNNKAIMELRAEALKIAESGNYELLVVYKDSKEKSSVYKKKQGNCEIIIISDKTDEIIFKQLLGDFSLKKNGD
jgi:RNAse (barnase) inhibitor barstar